MQPEISGVDNFVLPDEIPVAGLLIKIELELDKRQALGSADFNPIQSVSPVENQPTLSSRHVHLLWIH